MSITYLFELFEKEEAVRYNDMLEANSFDSVKRDNIYRIGYDRFISLLEGHCFGKTSLTGENLDGMLKYNLDTSEAAIIYMYTNDIHSEINPVLLNNGDHKDVLMYSSLLNKVLEKMPSFSSREIFRSEHTQNIDFYKSFIGREFEEKRFLSCHQDNTIWHDEEGLQLIIKTKENSNAKDLSELSFNANEKEVLFKSRSLFNVMKVDSESRIIYLNEV